MPGSLQESQPPMAENVLDGALFLFGTENSYLPGANGSGMLSHMGERLATMLVLSFILIAPYIQPPGYFPSWWCSVPS